MFSRWSRTLVIFIASCVMVFTPAAYSGESEFPEGKIKAALIYNFMRFVDWPEEQNATGVICVIGVKQEYRQALKFLTTQQLNQKNITLREINGGKSGEVLGSCQIIFVTTVATDKQKQKIINSAGNALIIAEDSGLNESGVMINLIRDKRKIGFEINMPNVKASNIRISSKILRLADKVIQ